jgi:hypothetical protein
MKAKATEQDLDELSEPPRSTAFELLWLLRESGHSEELAVRLALRGAHEAHAARLDGGGPAPAPFHPA